MMKHIKVLLKETHQFSKLFLDYIGEKKELRELYNNSPTQDGISRQVRSKKFDPKNRKLLVEVLKEQYSALDTSDLVIENIESLSNTNTYTITTGHQLSIFTGPLFFIYKIITTINLCEKMKKALKDYHFVPIFWMASEDHDFEEINHFHSNLQKWKWSSLQKGSVGKFHPEKSIQQFASSLPQKVKFFQEAYCLKTLSDACRYYVNHLFKDYGLVILDADHKILKGKLSSITRADIINTETLINSLKAETILKTSNYPSQINIRDINFFWMEHQIRERIIKKNTHYQVVNTSILLTEKQMEDKIRDSPEFFSPNVAIRPLYQEIILPNTAYVGGPSEINYWLQLKPVFDHYNIQFPVLIPRNFVTILKKKKLKKWEKTHLPIVDIFHNPDKTIKKWIKTNSTNNLSLTEEIHDLDKLFYQIQLKFKDVDPSLFPHVKALKTIFSRKLERAEKKLVRAETRKFADRKQQIIEVVQEVFPNEILQERHNNLIDYYVEDPLFIEKIRMALDPLSFKMNVITG